MVRVRRLALGEGGRERLDPKRRRKRVGQMSDHQLCGVTSCGPVGLGSVCHICGLLSWVHRQEASVVVGTEPNSCINP